MENNKHEQDEKLRQMNYPPSEDLFNNAELLSIDDEETPMKRRETVENFEMGLDVPGGELDDAQENLGSEDEENNYYSTGGDNHTDLDEREDIV